MERPVIAVTLGDPNGIGPELVVKVLSSPTAYTRCRPLVVGDPEIVRKAVDLLGTGQRVRSVAGVADAEFAPGCLDVSCPPGLRVANLAPGQLDPAVGRAAAQCFAHAYALVAAGQVQGVAAAPMNKQAFHLAGYNYFDELEYLAELTKSPDAHMLGTIGVFWTHAVTAHVPFRSIPELITKERVLLATRRLADVLVRTGQADPRIAVAALNVHGGEGGLFGREELDEIGPAIESARRLGIRVVGPVPADTVFVRAREGEFSGVVAMYHDQANIARKLLATRKGATVYLGLPVVCTTTAHGTAFDRAWQGVAETGSMEDSLRYAIDLAV